MTDPRVKKSITTLAQRVKEITQRKPTQEQIDNMNQIFDCIDRQQDADEGNKKDQTLDHAAHFVNRMLKSENRNSKNE